MKKTFALTAVLLTAAIWNPARAQEGTIPAFPLKPCRISLERPARPGTPFDKVGRKFAVLGEESGSFEAWAYPLKLFRNFQLSFLVGTSTRPIPARDIVRSIRTTPEATTLTYVYQSFTIKTVLITPVDKAGAFILLDVRSTVPLTIICGFLPVLQPMWPAGIGGQYAYWDNKRKAYIISESSGKNHALVGSPAASGISYTPAHMLSDNPSEFKIGIPKPETVMHRYIPIIMAGGPGKFDRIVKIYEDLLRSPQEAYLKTAAHYRNLLNSTLRIHTPDPNLDLAFSWAKVSFDNLMVNNPNLGLGMVAGLGASGTSGRPGFGWFFGGDTFINSLSLLSYGAFTSVRDALSFTQKWQRKDGKMAHELSQAEGYIDWWHDYHYGYIHGDTTPYYIAAMYEYLRWTGDTAFIEKSWNSLKRAYNWCLSTDADKDGLMDNKKAGLGALEYGALTGIATDIYLGAVWVRAAYAMAQLAQATGHAALARRADTLYQKARKAFDDLFWDEEAGIYAYAFDSQGRKVKEISPWSAVGLMWELGNPDKSRRTLKRMSSADLNTDWGIRSISLHSQYFQPLNYNYGAVWPFLTSWMTTALYRHHMPLQAYAMLQSTVRHTFDNSLGNVTEVFSGTLYTWPQEAVSHQGFSSAGVVLPFVRGLLGLDGDAREKYVCFSPQCPAGWIDVSVENYTVGGAVFSIRYHREKGSVSARIEPKNAGGFLLDFAPALTKGIHITSVLVNGRPASFDPETAGTVFLPRVSVKLKNDPVRIDIRFTPTLEILPALPDTHVGDSNTGLKIISVERTSTEVILDVEGLSGYAYSLGVLNGGLIDTTDGGDLKENQLKFLIPGEKTGEFRSHTIRITLKPRLDQRPVMSH